MRAVSWEMRGCREMIKHAEHSPVLVYILSKESEGERDREREEKRKR